MLGVRRGGVTEAGGKPEKAGVLRLCQRNGHIARPASAGTLC